MTPEELQARAVDLIAVEMGIGRLVLRDAFKPRLVPCLCREPGCSGVKVSFALEVHDNGGRLQTVGPGAIVTRG